MLSVAATNPPAEHAEFSPTCMNTDGSHGECIFTCSADTNTLRTRRIVIWVNG